MQGSPAYDRYLATVLDNQGVAVEASCQVFVFTAGGTTLATIYSDPAATAKTNPIAAATFATDKGVDFWGTKDGSYDVLIVHNDGRAQRINSFSPTGPKQIRLDDSPLRHRIFAFGNANTVETDSGLDLTKDEIVSEVIVEVVTNVASGTVDVGLLSSEAGGDLDGFADAVSTAAAGFIRPGVAHANGTNIDFVNTVTRGVLLANFLAGSDAVASPGYYAEKVHRCDGVAKSLVYNSSNHAHAGYIHVLSQALKG